jgi:superoxide dismutase, Fe-Mn family
MYEHAYAIDYGAVAPRYIDAFMANLDWEAVEKRWQAAKRLRI